MVGRQVIFGGICAGVFGFGSLKLFNQLVVVDSFIPINSKSEAEDRIENYIPLVKETSEQFISSNRNVRSLNACADRWISEWDKGNIRPVFASYQGDCLQEGPRGEVITTCYQLAQNLCAINASQAKLVTPERTVKNSIRVLRLINIVRFFNVDSACTGGLLKQRPLRLIAKYLPQCGSAQASLANEVIREEDRSSLLSSQLKHHEHSLESQYVARFGNQKESYVQTSNDTYAKFSLTASNNYNSALDRELISKVRACGFAKN
jgi:hypothetical protein